MTNLKNFSPFYLDVLKEAGNIGAGNAATALSSLLNRKIDMSVPSVRIVEFEEITKLAGGEEKIVAATFLRIYGEAPGTMFLIIPEQEAVRLAAAMIGQAAGKQWEIYEDDLAVSALQELGNILAGSYLSALSDFTNINMQPSVPAMAVDMAGALVGAGLAELSAFADYAIIIDTEVREEGRQRGSVFGQFFLLPDPDSFHKIFAALGVQIDE
ncbi:chemotaxis protein CheC [Alteribacillus sp. HJP-4]|uniref:chemotaxis protein CheC n=1 Tax=Alteribacillus sp. HJP-4 TaxID=2775394 RepID=UPI0035CCE985